MKYTTALFRLEIGKGLSPVDILILSKSLLACLVRWPRFVCNFQRDGTSESERTHIVAGAYRDGTCC